MKKFLIRIAAFGVFCLALVAAVSISIDPYSVFHPFAIRDNGIEADKNYIKMKYILSEPEKFDAFIFGSSRVGAIFPEKLHSVHCYNMTYSMGLPKDHLQNITTMVDNGLIPKRIYIGVDSLSYTMDPEIHKNFLYQYSYEMARDDALHFWRSFFDASMAFDSLFTSRGHEKEADFVSDFYDYGCWKTGYRKPKNLDYLKDGAFIGTDDFKEDVLGDMAQIVEICRKNRIELVVFTNPMHHLTFDASVEDAGWYDFVTGLAQVTDFVNFAGLNAITTDDYNYNDTSHYIAGVGDRMIRRLEGEQDTQAKYGESFGFAVNAGNAAELVEIWEKERRETEKYTTEDPPLDVGHSEPKM